MNIATITFTDSGSQVGVKIDFGEGGMNEASYAHHLAVEAMTCAVELLRSAQCSDEADDEEQTT